MSLLEEERIEIMREMPRRRNVDLVFVFKLIKKVLTWLNGLKT